AEALQIVVMKHDRNGVGCILQIAFDGETRVRSPGKAGERILPDAPVEIVKTAMGDRPFGEPAECHQAISMMASISTAALSGSDAMPTAARACLPASPSAPTSRLEAPLRTRCCSTNSGEDATKPLI